MTLSHPTPPHPTRTLHASSMNVITPHPTPPHPNPSRKLHERYHTPPHPTLTLDATYMNVITPHPTPHPTLHASYMNVITPHPTPPHPFPPSGNPRPLGLYIYIYIYIYVCVPSDAQVVEVWPPLPRASSSLPLRRPKKKRAFLLDVGNII